MSYLSIPRQWWPLATRAYSNWDSAVRHQYNCLFHSVEKNPEKMFCIGAMKNHGFSYVLSGSATLRYGNDECIDLYPGCFFYLNPDNFISLEVDPTQTWRECSLSIHTESAAHLIKMSLIRPELMSKDVGIQTEIIDAYKECMHIFEQAAELHPGIALAAVTNCLQTVYWHADKDPQKYTWIDHAKAVLKESLGTRMSMETIANKLDMNYHAFRRKFKASTHYAPGDWLIQQRIQRAQDLLQHKSIDAVADELGYPDRFVFSKQFKHLTGYAPKQYQREILRMT